MTMAIIQHGNGDTPLPRLSTEFMNDFYDMCKRFDVIINESLFLGEKLEAIVAEFIRKYQNYIEQFPFAVENVKVDPRKVAHNSTELIDEDYRIVSGPISPDPFSEPAQWSVNEVTEYLHGYLDVNAHLLTYADILADLYTKACCACYLRITYNKSRHNKEDQRREALLWGRLSIRFQPNRFRACFWHMIATGWYLNALSHPRERTLIGRIFKEVTLRCCKMDPKDPLGYNLLGRYHYAVANLTWIERTLGKTMLGANFDSTFDDAEREILKSHSLKDNWITSGLWMARVLLAKKRPKSEIKKWIDFGLQCECTEPTGELDRAELLELRAKLKLVN